MRPPQNSGRTFASLTATDPTAATKFSKVFLASIETRDQATQFFDQVARATPADRLAILSANRDAASAPQVDHRHRAAARGRRDRRDEGLPAAGGVRDDAAFASFARVDGRGGCGADKPAASPFLPSTLRTTTSGATIGGRVSDIADAIKGAFNAVVNAIG